MEEDMSPPDGDGGRNQDFDYRAFIAKHDGATIADYEIGQAIYAQGDPADALFYIISGTVIVTTISEQGKEAVVAILGPGDFFGEGCVDGILLRRTTIKCATPAKIVRLKQAAVLNALKVDSEFASIFLSFVLHRNNKLQADLVDQLFNSSEKRLARILLTLASAGLDAQTNMISVPVTQEMLANMVGTTRSRINQYMMKFRKLGYIDYIGQIHVHSFLLNIILSELPQTDH
jgi:CRP/FNR family cyclic AMP-dependent transcriptional regulator